MSNGAKKAWPYIIVLIVLAAVAIFTEDYMPFDLFGNNEKVEDTVTAKVDTITIEPVITMDTTTVADTAIQEEVPVVEESSAEKQWRLVVASVPSKEEAENIAVSVGGNTSVKYVEYLDTYRVVYDSYPNLRDAQSGFDEISLQYPKAWLVYF